MTENQFHLKNNFSSCPLLIYNISLYSTCLCSISKGTKLKVKIEEKKMTEFANRENNNELVILVKNKDQPTDEKYCSIISFSYCYNSE